MAFRRLLILLSTVCFLRLSLPLSSVSSGFNKSVLADTSTLVSSSFVTPSLSRTRVAFSFTEVGKFFMQLDRKQTSFWAKACEFLGVGALGHFLPGYLKIVAFLATRLLQGNPPISLSGATPTPAIASPPVSSMPLGRSLMLYGSGFASGWTAAEGTAFFNQRLFSTHCIKNGPHISKSFIALQEQVRVYKTELSTTRISLEKLNATYNLLVSHSNTFESKLVSAETTLNFTRVLYLKSTESYNAVTTSFNRCRENLTLLSTDLLRCSHNESLNTLKLSHLNTQINKIKNLPVNTLRKESTYWASLAQYVLPSECYFGTKTIALHTGLRESTGVVACKDIWDVTSSFTREVLVLSVGFGIGYTVSACCFTRSLSRVSHHIIPAIAPAPLGTPSNT